MGKSRKDYEKYLNSISPDRDDEAWIIGGKNRYCGRENYGTMIKRYETMSIKVIRYRLPSYWACPLINDDYTGLTDEECEEIHKIQDMERLNFETLFRIVRWDYNRCFKDESLDKDLFVEKYGRVMGEHYYNKFVHEFNGNILKMVGYFRGSEKEGQVFCDMITECIEKYEQRGLYSRDKLNN